MSFLNCQLTHYRKRKENGTALWPPPIHALPIKPYWSSGKLLYSSPCPMIEDDNFYFIFQVSHF